MTRKIFAAPIAALALIAAAPVPSAALASNNSQPTSATGSRSGDAASAKSERKICKTFHMSGSHAKPERLCLTRAQWKEFNDAQEQN